MTRYELLAYHDWLRRHGYQIVFWGSADHTYRTTTTNFPALVDAYLTSAHVPTDPPTLGRLIWDEPAPAPKPDLWDRLRAQEGYEAAHTHWSRACAYMDALMDPNRNEDDE